VDQTGRKGEAEAVSQKLSIIDHTYDKLFCTYLDLVPLYHVYLVLENGNFILEKSWKCPGK